MLTKLILGEENGNVSIFDYLSGKQLKRFAEPPGPPTTRAVVNVAFVATSNSIVAAFANGIIHLYDITGEALDFIFKYGVLDSYGK